MAKKRKKIDTRQLNLFEYIGRLRASDDGEGALNVRDPLRRALNRAIKEFGGSRFEIAGAMSHLLGVEITKAMIDSWTAESKFGNRIAAEYLPAFCEATKNLLPLTIINEAAGNIALPGPDAIRSEIQRWTEQEKKARAEKRKRQIILKELESGGFAIAGDRRRRKGRRTYD